MRFSDWTSLDYIFALLIIVSTVLALTKGLVREIVSLVALLAGFWLAAFYYPRVSAYFSEIAKTQAVADLIGFMIIFLGTLLAGAIVAFLINRFVKMASLQWVDRLLGGLFGFLRGWAVASILVLALVAFPVKQNQMLSKSYLAPFLLGGARAAVLAVPQSLKDRFYQEYKRLLETVNTSRKPS